MGGQGRDGDPAMSRYEYTHTIIPRRDGTPMSQTDHVHPEELDAVLNAYGADGWDVWQVDGSIVRFKREIDDGGGVHPG